MTEDLDHIQDNVPYKELVPFAESIHSDRILRENNEKMRQEFTANVSHELKTPLTSISGYAELIETGIAKPEDVPGFAQKIHVEASRMIQLVNDIPQLSSLDNASEAGSEPEMETVDLLGRCQGLRRAPEAECPPGLHLAELFWAKVLLCTATVPCWMSCARTCAIMRSVIIVPAVRYRSPQPAAATDTAP